ncbi:hydrogen peroxide-inducible genes activator [Flagellimonas eckloniae]|uniref:LysR family transcriptional regulator n=1 Tax=Flagellimonas eckloniae TaxID=346185 RepID=A0A0Q1BL40_9FLAO|nr:hydrogen peroxide-inducible genes activator [Allomuricauda eckloniae]KQC31418.1 LysR family transcriptional regulator [Allomuricauda eckloniae]
MTLQQLKYIVALDEERHFGRAAEACVVSQPGLTIQLKKLEEEIGIQLFDRTKVPLKPTAMGEEIIVKARKLLKDADHIREFIIEKKNLLQGTIKLGVVITLSPYLIPLAIDNIKKSMPKVNFIIEETSTVGLMESLENGSIDIALMATPTGNNNLKEFSIFNEQFVAYLNPSHSSSNEEFYTYQKKDYSELLLLKEEFCYNAQLLNICDIKEGKKKMEQFNFDVTSIETLKNLVRADLGYAIIPELSILHEKNKHLIKPFKNPRPVREISLVVSQSFSKTLILEKLKDAIWNSIPESCREISNYKKISWDDSPYFRQATSK